MTALAEIDYMIKKNAASVENHLTKEYDTFTK